jgi:hypothetical protein
MSMMKHERKNSPARPMIYRGRSSKLSHRVGVTMRNATALLMLCALASPLHAAGRAQPPWHIESFCHRGAAPAHRCLVRARQGIIVFQVAELGSAPGVSWSDGVAVLSTGASASSRQLRFFVPPQKLSAAFSQVRAYDVAQQRVAVYSDGQLHVRAMFADAAATKQRDVAVLALPSDLVADTLHASFDAGALHASWQDRSGHSQQRTLALKD